jgi:hypothetical protein
MYSDNFGYFFPVIFFVIFCLVLLCYHLNIETKEFALGSIIVSIVNIYVSNRIVKSNEENVLKQIKYTELKSRRETCIRIYSILKNLQKLKFESITSKDSIVAERSDEFLRQMENDILCNLFSYLDYYKKLDGLIKGVYSNPSDPTEKGFIAINNHIKIFIDRLENELKSIDLNI